MGFETQPERTTPVSGWTPVCVGRTRDIKTSGPLYTLPWIPRSNPVRVSFMRATDRVLLSGKVHGSYKYRQWGRGRRDWYREYNRRVGRGDGTTDGMWGRGQVSGRNQYDSKELRFTPEGSRPGPKERRQGDVTSSRVPVSGSGPK